MGYVLHVQYLREMRAVHRSIVEIIRTRDNDTGFMISKSALLIVRRVYGAIALARCLMVLKTLQIWCQIRRKDNVRLVQPPS